jgi:hypothetical protein
MVHAARPFLVGFVKSHIADVSPDVLVNGWGYRGKPSSIGASVRIDVAFHRYAQTVLYWVFVSLWGAGLMGEPVEVAS